MNDPLQLLRHIPTDGSKILVDKFCYTLDVELRLVVRSTLLTRTQLSEVG